MHSSIQYCIHCNIQIPARSPYVQVTVTYRFGREEDEMMGLHFSKDMQLSAQQVR